MTLELMDREAEIEERPLSDAQTISRREPIQRVRLQVKVAPTTKDIIAPLFAGWSGSGKGAATVMREAEKLDVMEALRLLSEEAPDRGKQRKVIHVTPSQKLLQRAKAYYVPPHLLIRAAAVKVAQEMQRNPDAYGPYPEYKHPPHDKFATRYPGDLEGKRAPDATSETSPDSAE